MYEVKIIDFPLINFFWSTQLWPGRQSKIKPISSYQYTEDLTNHPIIDMNIYKENPTFFGLFFKNICIGVNSGFKTENLFYRSRGLWIDSNFRGQNLSQFLFEETEKQAKFEGCKYIWSIPRKSALVAYEKFNFVQTTNFFNEGMEFGPNCFVKKVINNV